jgi:hypothetical protein
MNDWIVRITHECMYSKYQYFITLTYSPENLPLDDEGRGCLVKADLQKWFKRVRKKQLIRYYAVGEYGSRFGRPHYHILLFTQKQLSYNLISKTWTNGHTHLGTITPASIAYCTKYMFVNKGDSKGRPSVFALMSRKPGIGFNKIKDLNKNPYVFLNGYKKRMPRYYKDKIFTKEEKLQIRQQMEELEKINYENNINHLKKHGYAHPEIELFERAKVNEKLIGIKQLEFKGQKF